MSNYKNPQIYKSACKILHIKQAALSTQVDKAKCLGGMITKKLD